MAMLTQVGLVRAKVETVAGTDATPTSTDSIMAFEPQYSIDPTLIERNYMRPSFSMPKHLVGRKLAQLSFSVEIMGSGTAGSVGTPAAAAPVWADLLQACAFSRTDPSTSPYDVPFAPLTTAQKTMTIYCYYDGLLHKLTGAMGTFTVNLEAGQIGRINFTFTGNYVAPTAVATPSFTPPATLPPLVESIGFTIGATTGLFVQSVTIDPQNTVVPRSSVNHPSGYYGMMITSRNPSMTINPESELEATHPFWTDLAAGNAKTITFTVGTVAGNIVKFDMPVAQLTNITYSDRDGIRVYDVNMGLRSTSAGGNDEIVITFK